METPTAKPAESSVPVNASRRPTVLIWVQHLLGTGHLERMRRIAEALSALNVDVHFVTGGVPLPGRMPMGVRIVQLPPVKVTDASFTPLRDSEGVPIDDAFRAVRAARLLETFDAAQPDVVLFETFPFGRRSLRFELMPLLERIETAKPRPLVVSSIRDILQLQEKPGRDAESWELARRWFDEVLVHGDPAFVRLDESFPLASDGRVALHYTGYVTSPEAAPPRAPLEEQREIVVSAGGGATGTHVLHAAIAARPLSSYRNLMWRVLVGPGIAEEDFQALVAKSEHGLVVERNRHDFAMLLSRARVSVSQGGYNTVMDVLRSGAPAVVVPFAMRSETEQRMRAERLAARGAIDIVEESELAPPTLAAAIDRAASRGARGALPFATEGAQRSAARLLELARGRDPAPER
ncbi:MAG TPA: glycosyltransferase [Casimicrobiaceae bacterium]|nr:glycosyltransferase [Casimicrobiaceae bacterium]